MPSQLSRRSALASLAVGAFTSMAAFTSRGRLTATSIQYPSGAIGEVALPPGYSFVANYTGRNDGFRAGEKEISWWYVNANVKFGHRHPLRIHFTSEPLTPFAGTEGVAGEPVQLEVQGRSVRGLYFDGSWALDKQDEPLTDDGPRVRWRTDNPHCLVFQLAGVTVGIRGCREAGVLRQHLVAAAESLQVV